MGGSVCLKNAMAASRKNMEFFRVAEEAKSIMFDAITIPELVIDVTDLLKKGLYYKNQMQLFTW